MKKIIYILILLSVNVFSLSAEFINPTSDNGTVHNRTYIEINTTMNSNTVREIIFSLNETNTNFMNNLLFYGNFNNVSNIDTSSTVNDISKYNTTGIIGLPIAQVPGKFSSAYSFSGADTSEISYTSSQLRISATHNFSFGGWFYPLDITDGGPSHLAMYKPAGACGLTSFAIDFYEFSPKRIIGVIGKACTYDYYTASSFIPDINMWYFVVVNYFSSTKNISLYINGVYDNSTIAADYGTSSNNDNFYIAGGSFTSTNFNGRIDDVFVYNRTLNLNEINFLYKSELEKRENNYLLFSNITNLEYSIYNYSVYASDSLTGGNTDNRYIILSPTTTTTITTTTEGTTTSINSTTTTTLYSNYPQVKFKDNSFNSFLRICNSSTCLNVFSDNKKINYVENESIIIRNNKLEDLQIQDFLYSNLNIIIVIIFLLIIFSIFVIKIEYN